MNHTKEVGRVSQTVNRVPGSQGFCVKEEVRWAGPDGVDDQEGDGGGGGGVVGWWWWWWCWMEERCT